MNNTNAKMKLGAFLYPTGYHVAAWRHKDVPADAGINFLHYAQLAKTAERGKLDFIFLADSVGIRGTDLQALSRTAIRYVAQFEPITLLSALAAVTDQVGLTATATTTYQEPYHLARMFASLDHISAGRAGWNLVTSQNPYEAFNFGLSEHPDHAQRYSRAREFAQVVKGLWDSWDDDAFVRDKESGFFFDPDKLHVLNHKGRFFEVRGPLNIPRPTQGHPVILQAGASEVGKDLAAETGEVVFTAQQNISDAQAFYSDVKGRLKNYDRSTDSLKILAGVFPFVGRTQKEAEGIFEELQTLIDPIVGLSLLGSELGGVDLSAYPLDSPLPTLPESNAGKSRQQLLIDMAHRENLSLRDLYKRVAGSRGHWQLVGTPARIADELQEWFINGAADGFMIMPPYLPGGLESFVELVVPELQRRNLFRLEYEGQTLRQNLGLRRPEDRSNTST